MRARFGGHWRAVLDEMEAAGLPAGMAAIAAMDRPDQQAAAQRLSVLAGTPTAELKARIGDEAARAVDAELRLPGGALGEPAAGPSGAATDAEAELARRLAYHEVGMGEPGVEAELARRLAFDDVRNGEHPNSAAANAARHTVKQADAIAGARADEASDTQGRPPYTLQQRQKIDALFADINAATGNDLQSMINRILGAFGDMPEFAAVIGRYTRIALGTVERPSITPEQAREALVQFRDLMLTDLLPGGWDYHQFPEQGRLQEFETSLRQLVEENRATYPLAAEYLARYLDGDGGFELLDPDELRSHAAVRSAESTNESTFEKWMVGDPDILEKTSPEHEVYSKLNALIDGETLEASTFWETSESFGLSESERDLHFAIGGFHLESRGVFKFTRTGDVIHVSGTIYHFWSDVYDWEPEKVTFLPSRTKTRIPHDDMLALRDFGGAEVFTSHSAWQMDVTGTLTLRNGVVVGADLDMVDNGWRPQDTGAL